MRIAFLLLVTGRGMAAARIPGERLPVDDVDDALVVANRSTLLELHGH